MGRWEISGLKEECVTMTRPIKKIFAVSLTQKKKYKGYAVYNGEQLVFQLISPIKGPFSEWRDPLIKEIEMRKKKGFIVFVEEHTDHIARHATQFFFEHVDPEEKRINYYMALDWYFSLDNMGNLILPTESQNHAIRENKIDRQQDEKGRTKYIIDWERFTGAQRTILLCVMAAVGVNPVSGNYLKEFFDGLDDGIAHYDDPWKSFKAVTTGYDIAKSQELDKAKRNAYINRTGRHNNGQAEPI